MTVSFADVADQYTSLEGRFILKPGGVDVKLDITRINGTAALLIFIDDESPLSIVGQPRALAATLRDLADRIDPPFDAPEPPQAAAREPVTGSKITRGRVTYQQELIRCGKDCWGCPHGPYWYAYYRKAGRTVSKYIGKEFKPLD